MSDLSTPAPTAACAPTVRFFSGRSESFMQCGSEWRRLTVEDEARHATGCNRETRAASVGVYILPKGNGLVCVGFDLWKIDANLRPSAVEHFESQWRQREAANLSKSRLRHAQRRSHFSKSFARFEVSPDRLEDWKAELSAVLSNPESYQSL